MFYGFSMSHKTYCDVQKTHNLTFSEFGRFLHFCAYLCHPSPTNILICALFLFVCLRYGIFAFCFYSMAISVLYIIYIYIYTYLHVLHYYTSLHSYYFIIQLISLGAGFDTCIFRLHSEGSFYNCRVFEVRCYVPICCSIFTCPYISHMYILITMYRVFFILCKHALLNA